jgi:hypothetical protein
MNKNEIIKLINFFEKIEIVEDDVTTPEEKANGQRVVIVTYKYNSNVYTTNKLYYRDIAHLSGIKNKDLLMKYFVEPVYWLDIGEHDWPQGKNESNLEKLVIGDMANEEDTDFIVFLKQLANNPQTGKIQENDARRKDSAILS